MVDYKIEDIKVGIKDNMSKRVYYQYSKSIDDFL
jgi:hypothetical protein